MNILYVVPSLSNRGPVIVARDLVEVMVKHGHQCKVIYFDDHQELKFDCETQLVKSKQFDFSGYDIVHSHGLRSDLFVRRNRKTSKTTRYITTIHNYVFQDFKYQYNLLISLIFGSLWMLCVKGFDRITVLSNDAFNYYSKFLPREKLRIAYNTRIVEKDTLSHSEAEKIKKFKSTDTLIGVNALLTKRKGIDQLIRVLSMLDGYKLFVVGDGKELPKLKQLAVDENVADRVCFAGYIDRAYRYIQYYDICAVPSRSEGFPISLLEAAIMQKKVVVSNIPIFKETFSDDEVSFFELENITSLKDAIIKAENNELLMSNIYRRYENNYTPENLYKNYISIYCDGI